jgi:hypothetical protein
MKEQEQIPEDVVRLQKERLSKDEFEFCKKLFEQTSTMSAHTNAQKEEILQVIKNKASDKYKIKITDFDNPPKGLQIYNFYVNDKRCYIVFDILGAAPVNIIPSGVIMPQTN